MWGTELTPKEGYQDKSQTFSGQNVARKNTLAMSSHSKVKCHFVLKDHDRDFSSSGGLLKPFGPLFVYFFMLKEILKFSQEISLFHIRTEKSSESQQLYVIGVQMV